MLKILANVFIFLTGKIFSKSKRKKYILFPVRNELMFSYAVLCYKLLFPDARLQIYFVFSQRELISESKILFLKEKYKIRTMPAVIAKLFPWDLIIYTDHQDMLVWQKYSKKIYIGHGIIAGKGLSRGNIYSFEYKNTINRDGGLIYDKIFVSSDGLKQVGIRQYPKLSNSIVTTGSLMFDEFMKISGTTSNDCKKNVLIASTWGTQSLIQREGNILSGQIHSLSKKYDITLSIHPFNFLKIHSGGVDWLKKLNELEKIEGIEVVKNTIDSIFFLAKADLLITDHTSLSLFYLAADRPIIFLFLEKAFLHAFSPFHNLREKAFTISDLSNLESKIDDAFRNYRAGSFIDLLNNIVSYKYKADERYKKEIYSVLDT